MQRYGLSVYRYCRRMLGADADGDDVSQIVFMQAFEAIQRRAAVHDAGAWLLGIARNRCLTGDEPGALRVRVARALTALRRCMDRKGRAR
jgi:Sigma-70 region 2